MSIQLAAFEIAREVCDGAAPYTATVTVLSNWFNVPFTKRQDKDNSSEAARAIDRLAGLIASHLSASS